MSYILEALKKSNAERERGAVPHLHAQPLALDGAGDEEVSRRDVPLLWLAVGMVITLSAALAWHFGASTAPPMLAATPAATPVAAPAPAPAPALAVASAPAPAPAIPTAIARATSAEPGPATPPAAVAPVMPAPRTRAKIPTRPATPKVPVTEMPASAPQPATRVPLLAELPDELRRQVPAMTIGGSVNSPQPASRMLLVNGQVLREGGSLAPDVQLEQIGPKAAVFTVRGQRFEVPL